MTNCNNCGNANCVPKEASCVICGEPVDKYVAYPDDMDIEGLGTPEIQL